MASSLLHRQLASITDTLLRASQHQDTILRDRANMPSKHTPTMPTHTLESTLSVPSKAQLPHTGGSRRSSLGFEYEDEDSGSAAGGCQLQDTAGQQQADRCESNDADNDIDATALVAEPGCAVQRSSNIGTQDGCNDVEDLNRARLAGVDQVSTNKSESVDDPREMIREINRQSLIANRPGTDQVDVNSPSDPKAMLADLNREKEVLSQDRYKDDGDIEAVHCESATGQSLSNKLEDQNTLLTTRTMTTAGVKGTSHQHSQGDTAEALDPDIITYVVALMLESSGYKWEEINAWCTYLFGSGMNTCTSEQEKKTMIQKENTHALKKTHLRHRLILSNLAADVELKDIRMFFSKYRRDIRAMTLLSECDPVKRTRSAHVDMFTRKAAIRASFEVGQIFGLVVKIQLASD